MNGDATPGQNGGDLRLHYSLREGRDSGIRDKNDARSGKRWRNADGSKPIS